MTRLDKARELMNEYGFKRNDHKVYEQYEKTYKGKEKSYLNFHKTVTVTVEIYDGDDEPNDAEFSIEGVLVDDSIDTQDMRCVANALENAASELDDLFGQLEDFDPEE